MLTSLRFVWTNVTCNSYDDSVAEQTSEDSVIGLLSNKRDQSLKRIKIIFTRQVCSCKPNHPNEDKSAQQSKWPPKTRCAELRRIRLKSRINLAYHWKTEWSYIPEGRACQVISIWLQPDKATRALVTKLGGSTVKVDGNIGQPHRNWHGQSIGLSSGN